MKRSVANALFLTKNLYDRTGYAGGGAPSASPSDDEDIVFDPRDYVTKSLQDELSNPMPRYQEPSWYDTALSAAKSVGQDYMSNVAEEANSGRSKLSHMGRPLDQAIGAAQWAFAPVSGAAKSVGRAATEMTGNPTFGDEIEFIGNMAMPGEVSAASKFITRPMSEAMAMRGKFKSGGTVSEYPLLDKSDWKKHENYLETGGKMTRMTPKKFLKITQHMDMTEPDKKAIKYFKKRMKKGKGLNPLAIFPAGGQDGRHRAMAAKKLGIKELPVIRWPNRHAD